jgi:hypothetical protein
MGRKLGYLATGAFLLFSNLGGSYDFRDERSELITRMKKTMAAQDTAKEDPRDMRDRIVSTRECALLLEDLGLKDEYAYDSGSVSIGAEKNGGDIAVFITVGNYTAPRIISIAKAREYLARRDKK